MKIAYKYTQSIIRQLDTHANMTDRRTNGHKYRHRESDTQTDYKHINSYMNTECQREYSKQVLKQKQ